MLVACGSDGRDGGCRGIHRGGNVGHGPDDRVPLPDPVANVRAFHAAMMEMKSCSGTAVSFTASRTSLSVLGLMARMTKSLPETAARASS